MIRHETTFHPNYELATYKEYNEGKLVYLEIYNEQGILTLQRQYNIKGKLIKEKTYKENGQPLYSYDVGDYEIFWYEYKYNDKGELVSFWNSHGQYNTYKNGLVSSMSTIKLHNEWFPVVYEKIKQE